MSTEFAMVWAKLGPDERRVMMLLAHRLLAGQLQYGKLNLDTDKRDFRQERSQEIQDLLIYSAFLELQALRSPDATDKEAAETD